jgi:hypothetical protein
MTAGENPSVPGATDSTVVPGSTSGIAGADRGTALGGDHTARKVKRMSDGLPNAGQAFVLDRRRLIAAATTGIALGTVGETPPAPAQSVNPAGADASRSLSITDSAVPVGGLLQSANFGLLGVFDIDWLLEPRYTRLLDYFAASPGAFTSIRFFGALNSGEREDTIPSRSGGVWLRREDKPDFAVTLDALDALVSRGIVPFVTLSFFPPAVSDSPVTPPRDFSAWAELVQAFLHACVSKFGAAEVGRWRLEVWNEPNFAPFWRSNFDRYLDLYRATSDAVSRTGYAVRLGGPTLVYTPDSDGAALMETFLRFLANEPAMQCNFISYHRKGAWFLDQDAPWLGGLQAAAEEIAEAVLRLAPERAHGLELINNEGDMKVGFDMPFEPRMTERFPTWLAASLIVHQNLSEKYAAQGMQFIAASDNANQHLIRTPFDGRRSVMTRASAASGDLLKLPVYAFYELLLLLGPRRATAVTRPSDGFPPASDLLYLPTVGESHVGVLFTAYPDRHKPMDPGGPGWTLDYSLTHIPWPRINAVWFLIDHAHTNPMTVAGGADSAGLGAEKLRRVRTAQELGVAAPIRSGVILPEGGAFRDSIRLAAFATALLWITPFSEDPPAAPAALTVEVSDGNALLRWTSPRSAAFYTYEVFRLGPDGQPGPRLSPVPLRSALWVDTAPPPGTHVYAVRAVTASGVTGPLTAGPPVRI